MFRLPVCPHCGTVYRYRDTLKAQRQKDNTCYHCGKSFRAGILPGAALEALILLPLCVGFNILLLTRMERLDLFALFASTAVFILLAYVCSPYFTRFKKSEQKAEKHQHEQQNKIKNKKNNSNITKKQQTQQKRRS